MIPVLVAIPQTVVIHIGSNDIAKFNYHDVDVNDLANRILQIGLKCRYYGVESITISSVLVKNDNNLIKLIRRVNISLKHLCKVYGFDFTCQDRIGKDLLWRDGLHLTAADTSLLAINFLNFLNSYQKHGNLPDRQSILSKSINAKPETQILHLRGCLSYVTIVFPDLR